MYKYDSNNLIWIDLEMTGLNPDKDKIIEISTIVTNSNLNILDIGPSIVIHQNNKYLDKMNNWNLNVHNFNGLIDKVKKSTFNELYAEFNTLLFLKKWVPKYCSPMCGNTIFQDRRFLFKYMPKLESYFHYRNIDVSTLKELIRRWFPNKKNNLNKKNCHNSLFDIKNSIYELKYYRNKYLICGNSSVGRV